MPLYKFFFNRMLTAFQNIFLGVKLSEYHTGFRAFSRELLETLPLLENSDDFVFDNQMIAQAVMFGFKIREFKRQIAAGVSFAVGSDVGPFPHGTQARELTPMVQNLVSFFIFRCPSIAEITPQPGSG
jgi:hypothetical protein